MVFYGTTPNSYPNHVSSTNQTSYDKQAGWNHNVLLTNLSPTPPTTTSVVILRGPCRMHSTLQQCNRHLPPLPLLRMVTWVSITPPIPLPNWLAEHNKVISICLSTWAIFLMPMITRWNMRKLGNHESWCRNPICALQTKNFTTYKEKFRMPGNESGSGTNMFYSFDFYNIHFVAISTESDYPGAPVRDPEPDP